MENWNFKMVEIVLLATIKPTRITQKSIDMYLHVQVFDFRYFLVKHKTKNISYNLAMNNKFSVLVALFL